MENIKSNSSVYFQMYNEFCSELQKKNEIIKNLEENNKILNENNKILENELTYLKKKIVILELLQITNNINT